MSHFSRRKQISQVTKCLFFWHFQFYLWHFFFIQSRNFSENCSCFRLPSFLKKPTDRLWDEAMKKIKYIITHARRFVTHQQKLLIIFLPDNGISMHVCSKTTVLKGLSFEHITTTTLKNLKYDEDHRSYRRRLAPADTLLVLTTSQRREEFPRLQSPW